MFPLCRLTVVNATRANRWVLRGAAISALYGRYQSEQQRLTAALVTKHYAWQRLNDRLIENAKRSGRLRCEQLSSY